MDGTLRQPSRAMRSGLSARKANLGVGGRFFLCAVAVLPESNLTFTFFGSIGFGKAKDFDFSEDIRPGGAMIKSVHLPLVGL